MRRQPPAPSRAIADPASGAAGDLSAARSPGARIRRSQGPIQWLPWRRTTQRAAPAGWQAAEDRCTARAGMGSSRRALAACWPGSAPSRCWRADRSARRWRRARGELIEREVRAARRDHADGLDDDQCPVDEGDRQRSQQQHARPWQRLHARDNAIHPAPLRLVAQALTCRDEPIRDE